MQDLTEGFTGRGGAVELADAHKDWTPGQIAQAVQGSAFPDRYDKVRDGAEKVLDAYGGAGGYSKGRGRTGGPDGWTSSPHTA